VLPTSLLFGLVLCVSGSASVKNVEPPPPAVVGGQAAATCQWPTTASLVYGGGSCSGTLVHPEVVVFAAHCSGSLSQIRLGETSSSPARLVPVSGCRTYPGYMFEVAIDDWAFCRLAEPVTDVPITPPVMGCETDMLTGGREVVVAGFGLDNDGNAGVKRWAWTTIARTPTASEDFIRVGGNGVGPCSGDSGGPAFVQAEDGSWHVFGILSGGASCGGPMSYMLIHRAMEWFETESGVDITPCHDADGTWNPTPACGGFAVDPMAEGARWEDGCATGISGPSGACGPPYHTEDDPGPPLVEISAPADRTEYAEEPARVDVKVDADDDPGWGVRRVWLAIDGVDLGYGDGEPLYDGAAPYEFNGVSFPRGVYEITAHAEDFAGNVAVSDVVTIAVAEQLPDSPEEDATDDTTEPGPDEPDDDDESSGSSDAGEEDAEEAGSSGDIEGCACRAGSRPDRAVVVLLIVVMGLAGRRGRGQGDVTTT